MSECDSGRRVTFWCHNHGSPWRVGQDGCDFARAEKAEAQVQRVRELHYGYDAMDGRRRCGCCGHPWPCLTALAVDGDGDE